MKSEAVLDEVKKYVKKYGLTDLQERINEWESKKEWELGIGRKVEVFNEGIGTIVSTPNFSAKSVEICDDDSWCHRVAIYERDRDIKWKYID